MSDIPPPPGAGQPSSTPPPLTPPPPPTHPLTPPPPPPPNLSAPAGYVGVPVEPDAVRRPEARRRARQGDRHSHCDRRRGDRDHHAAERRRRRRRLRLPRRRTHRRRVPRCARAAERRAEHRRRRHARHRHPHDDLDVPDRRQHPCVRSPHHVDPLFSIFGWILPPFFLYVIPFLVLREQWKGSDPTVDGTDRWKANDDNRTLWGWFAFYGLLPLVLFVAQIGSVASAGLGTGDVETVAESLDQVECAHLHVGRVGRRRRGLLDQLRSSADPTSHRSDERVVIAGEYVRRHLPGPPRQGRRAASLGRRRRCCDR